MKSPIDWSNPTLEGQLVTLRPFEEADIAPAWEMINEPVGNDLTATTESFSFDQIVDWYRSREIQRDRIDLAIVERATGEFAGEVVLNSYQAESNACSFRISLRGQAWFGRGLGTEATRLIVRYGFDRLALERIELEVLERNPRARRAYEKAGFVVDSREIDGSETWLLMSITAATVAKG